MKGGAVVTDKARAKGESARHSPHMVTSSVLTFEELTG